MTEAPSYQPAPRPTWTSNTSNTIHGASTTDYS